MDLIIFKKPKNLKDTKIIYKLRIKGRRKDENMTITSSS